MFIAALFTITSIWKQPKYPPVDEWIKNCGTYTIEYYSAIIKEGNLTFCDSTDRPRRHYTK